MNGAESFLDRREFIRLAGASLALAGLDGCTRRPADHILPYVDNRPELTPGVAQHYATAMVRDGYATGVIVESRDGRPTKIEGNPDHPASLGATGAMEQASVLQLYDPDRATHARRGSVRADWPAIAASLAPDALARRLGARGAGLHLLIAPSSSPLEEALLERVLEHHPDARIHMYAPLAAERVATPFVQHMHIGAAAVMLAVDSDFLASGPFHLRYARHFADGRRLARPGDATNRLYVMEPGFTPTGAAADHRFPVRPRDLEPLLRALLGALNGSPSTPAWLDAVARDLLAHRGRSVVIVGEHAPPELSSLGDAINHKLGAFEQILSYAPSALIGALVPLAPFSELVDALRARTVDSLVVVGGNPLYATPGALRFGELLRQARSVGYVGLYENETARGADWFVPMSHYLESWGDARAYDGTLSIVQPLVNPLHASITAAELYAALGGGGRDASAYALLRDEWRRAHAGADADEQWSAALRRGVVPSTAFARVSDIPGAAPTAPGRRRPSDPAQGPRDGPRPTAPTPPTPPTPPTADASRFDVVYGADPKVHDGAYANNGWLQELPAPLTTLTWGNAALMSPAAARRLGVISGDHVVLGSGERRLTLPALALPGHADDTISLMFGYGRTGAESGARGVGHDAYTLWPGIGTRYERDVRVERASGASALGVTQAAATMEVGRPVRSATLDEYRGAPAAVGERPHRVLSLYNEPPVPGEPQGPNQWAMTIDLNTCLGCGACVVACQAENNIPVVGAAEVRRGRAMHWIRIDRYFAEQESRIEALLQPMLCQHCERAPCEYVCPVNATVHSDDGLNEMVYNRCVGTRFCSNNCPYKVRRFNWYDYNRSLSETEQMVKNPDVTVRERGVMEKCTFCVQRIREAEIVAGRDGRPLRGSEVRTACQQVCPTDAITFGSLTDADSEMMRRRAQPRAYSVLHELGTEPRVRYLARVRNTNPDVPAEG